MVKISKNPSKIHTPNNEMQSHRPSFYNEGYHVSRTNETETAKKRTPNRSVFFPRYSALPRMRSEPVQTVAQIYFLFSRTGIGSDKNFGVRKHGHNINVPVFVVARSFPNYTSKSPTGRKLPRTISVRIIGERKNSSGTSIRSTGLSAKKGWEQRESYGHDTRTHGQGSDGIPPPDL